MRNSTSGTTLPRGTYTWLIANQALGAGAGTSVGVNVPGARVANGHVVATARTALPLTAAGSGPVVTAFISAADIVTIRLQNPAAGALVALGADVVFDIMVLPIDP
jgi:hypothetical protein